MMGMIDLIKETNKMLADTICRLKDICSVLSGPPLDKSNSTPAKSPESLLDDVTFTHSQAMQLMDITAGIENVLRGEKCREEVSSYDPRLWPITAVRSTSLSMVTMPEDMCFRLPTPKESGI